MAWNLIAPNTWSNSKSPYLIKFDSITNSFIVEDIDGKNFIPLDDIFNNPAFPAYFGDIPVLGKHFRAEGANTPTTPGFSFQGDINTGFFRKSEDTVGFSAGGIQYGEFGVGYGGFTGNIIQIVSTAKTDTSTFSTTFGTISGLSQSITPKYSNSKILILINISIGRSSDNVLYFKILRGSTDIYVGDLAGSRTLASSMNYMSTSSPGLQSSSITLIFLDSPATTSLTTYNTQARCDSGSGFINRTGTDTDSAYYSRNASSITLMEVQQ